MTRDEYEAASARSKEDGEEDYYFDGPFLVFTAAYHLKRGFCCQSGCRHCPYGFQKNENTKPGSKRLKEEI